MAEFKDREHYIPLRQSDLLSLLCKDIGNDRAAVESLKELEKLLSATFHYEYFKLLNDLKDQYAPFDPDAVTKKIEPVSDGAERSQRVEALYEQFVYLMERANFKRLTLDEMKQLTKEVSDWGLNMYVDFSMFEKLEIFVRGDTTGTRHIRRWYSFWKQEEVHLPIYKRMVIFAKMKPHPNLPAQIDTNAVFLKVFKDIPKMDMEMLLPGASMGMPAFDRAKLGISIVGGGAWVLYSIFGKLPDFVEGFGFGFLVGLFGPLTALAGFGWRQWAGYQNSRTVFSLRLTQSLYYQTLGTNLSVLFHLLDEAEEQECREALLAYYYLWRRASPDGWTALHLDDYVELDLERLADLKVDFEIDDALAKLERLKLVTKTGDRYKAVPMEKALETLDYAWDNYFKYNLAGTQSADLDGSTRHAASISGASK